MHAISTQSGWTTFDTALGVCGIAWDGSGITRLCLPEPAVLKLNGKLIRASDSRKKSRPPARIRNIVEKVIRHFEGSPQDFSGAPLRLDSVPPFHKRVYAEARKIPVGETRSYGQLAAAVGSPSSARAVGQALARNPIGLIVPCHRVLASGRRPGGFSAHGGIGTKSKMLSVEGIGLEDIPVVSSQRDLQRAALALQKADRVIAGIIAAIETLDFSRKHRGSPYSVLFEAIVHQQLRPAAALTILNRVKALHSTRGFPAPQELLDTPDVRLREAGLSRAKAAALKDLAKNTLTGVVPSPEAILRMTDEAIVKRLTSIHGVGRWTAEMLLIFYLGRMDVLPVHDFALRNAIGRAYGLGGLPTPAKVAALGQKWRPYRTVASLYFWESLRRRQTVD